MMTSALDELKALLELPPQDLIGGLLIALILAVLTSSVFAWASRVLKATPTALTTMVLGVNVCCLIVGAHYAQTSLPPRWPGLLAESAAQPSADYRDHVPARSSLPGDPAVQTVHLRGRDMITVSPPLPRHLVRVTQRP